VYIFVREDQIYNKVDISHHCKEQVLEICAIQLETKASALIIISLYRGPSGDFNQFIKQSDATLKYLHNPKSELLICGNINMDHLNENWKKQLNSLLTKYNLSLTVKFATSIHNVSCTVTENIFVDNTEQHNLGFCIFPPEIW
jgi:hypothetical protein